MKSVAVYVACSVFAGAVATRSTATSWWTIETDRKFVSATATAIEATVLSVDLTRAKLRIVSVPFEAGRRPGGAELSLREFATVLSANSRYRDKEWIVVNGGFSSYSSDIPLGLLIVDGKVYSTTAKDRARSSQAMNQSEYSQYRWSGILCNGSSSDRWDIVPVGRYRPGMCQQALQAGPVPVEPVSSVAIASTEVKAPAYLRTVLCLVGASQMRVVITETPANLFPLAGWLSRAESRGGLGCSTALNLSGDTSSGVVVHPGNRPPIVIGPGSFPIPSALIFQSTQK